LPREESVLTENINAEVTEKPPKELVTDSDILSTFIEMNAVVVDKTALIRRLFESPISTFFLSRPRRFGKTLLLDTIQNIAEGNRELFSEMEIGKDGSDYSWKKYPVIRLDFAGLPTEPEAFKRRLLTKMNRIISLHGLDIEPVKDIAAIEDIIGKLSDRHSFAKKAKRPKTIPSNPRNVVLLIDEYDFPLLSSIDNSDRIDKIRIMLHEFYATIKSSGRMLRLTFITGVSKFSKLSIFSGLNNLIDISLNPDYSAICGFTEDEIKSNFSSHMLLALPYLEKSGQFPKGADVKYFLTQLKDWYDGYSFAKGKPNVYNPFSVTNCLSNKSFDYYWYFSGTSLTAYKFRHMADIYFKILSKDLNIKETLASVSDIKDLTIESLLFQTGYLTIDNTIDNIDNGVNNPVDSIIDSADTNIGNILNNIDNIDYSIDNIDNIVNNPINNIDSVNNNFNNGHNNINIGNTIINDKKSDKKPTDTKNTVKVITYKLKCPNNEIFFALIQDFVKMESPFPGFHGSINKTYSSFINSFNSLNAEECERTFSSFLGLSAPTLENLNETTFQNLLLCLLNIEEINARPEQVVGSGSYDIIYTTPHNTLIVIEIKYNKGKINKMSHQPKTYPPLDAKLPAFPEMDENVKKILVKLTADAFTQIVSKKYVRPFYMSDMKTIACTIAIHGYDDCLFRFYSIDWSSKKITKI
jgi:hypothetical protein